jgi:hypothetical protein
MPGDWRAEDLEKEAMVACHDRHPLAGYRRLTLMMLDYDVVAVSPSSVHRMLMRAGRLDPWWFSPSKTGTGRVLPLCAHEHPRVDVSYRNISATFYYLTSVLDRPKMDRRFIAHCKVTEAMTERDVEAIM